MKKRNITVDIMKLIASFFVVTLHFPFPNLFGQIFFAVARFAVPFFFMISGYFYAKSDKAAQYHSTKSRIRHLALLLLVSELLSFFIRLVAKYDFQYSFFHNIANVFTIFIDLYEPWKVISFTPLFNHTAWFLVQLIVVYLLYAGFTKLSILPRIKYWALTAFVLGFCAVRICALIHIALPPYSDYFILFMGFPFFSLGYFMKERKFTPNLMKNPVVCFVLLLVSIGLSYWESVLFPTADVYLGNILTNVILIILFEHDPGISPENWFVKMASYLGNHLSLYIYILHQFVGIILQKIMTAVPIIPFYGSVKPIVVFVVTSIISMAAFQINRTVSKRLCKR